ncbi:DUF4229 domain-containing protein [Cellulomonas cellasea]|uniref:DUF4229 domain-containing protein n=1 Tax=Cellulomonas cellasea TaxID=43670 RepID=UPI0025A3F1F4|nr:DUF4229 domain-containing protein [Cellulomonas cellasea]MDM8085537.1 DUF4229 domain-containing protein [Cellulomonas cellasea]
MPVVTYSLWRLGLFAVSLALLVWAGMGSWLAVLLAAFVAWALSYVLLGRQRQEAAQFVERRAVARSARAGGPAPDDADIEDAALDAAEREQGAS